MIYDVQMRWVLRWWWGIIPYWKLQYRKQIGYDNPGGHTQGRLDGRSVMLSWTNWQDVDAEKEHD